MSNTKTKCYMEMTEDYVCNERFSREKVFTILKITIISD